MFKNKKLLSGLIACGAIFLLFSPALAVQLAPDEDSAPVVSDSEEEIVSEEEPVVDFTIDPSLDLNANPIVTQHAGTYFAADENIILTDQYLSDVIVAGQTVTLSSDAIIEGDLIVAAETVNIYGAVRGDIRAAASNINLVGSEVGCNATLFAGYINIDQDTIINGDATTYAGQINLQGSVGKNLWIGSDNMNVTGPIYGNTYYPEEEKETTIKTSKPFITISQVFWNFVKLCGLLLIGVVLIYLFPKKFEDTTKAMFNKPGLVMLRGLGWVILTPLALVVLALTIIGLPFSVIGFILYGLTIYLSTLAVGFALGQKILPKATNLFWPLLLGTTIFYIAKLVPFAGGILGFLGVLWAVGAFSMACRCCKSKKTNKK